LSRAVSRKQVQEIEPKGYQVCGNMGFYYILTEFHSPSGNAFDPTRIPENPGKASAKDADKEGTES
jgi:hypothetical protein